MTAPIKILVTGASGQLGSEFKRISGDYPLLLFTFLSRNEVSITDTESIETLFINHRFDFCINCAAYTAVDKAESEIEEAYAVNAFAAAMLAKICYKYNAGFVHFSTDYVFNGNGNKPYQETDTVDPVSVYGASKLEGERLVMQENPNAVIIRTSWVFSSFGKNFVKTMIRLMEDKEQIKVVNDQLGCPTYASDLATVVLTMICSAKGLVPGIYHYCNEGITNWYSFANAIKNKINSPCEILPIETKAYPTAAKRPAYSVLDSSKIKNTYAITIPSWQHSLDACLNLLQS